MKKLDIILLIFILLLTLIACGKVDNINNVDAIESEIPEIEINTLENEFMGDEGSGNEGSGNEESDNEGEAPENEGETQENEIETHDDEETPEIEDMGQYKPDVSEIIFIGDSNTVRMYTYKTEIINAKHVSAIVGVSLAGFNSYIYSSNTTNNRSLREDLDGLSDSDLTHIVILLGTNDFGRNQDDIKESYRDIINYILNRNQDAVINISTIPPVNDRYSYSIKNDDVVSINGAVKSIADEFNLNLIDLYSNLNESDIDIDGFHLNHEGVEKAAKYLIENTI